ncbi:hypothetical protein F5B17DRAFT_421905 [Nemania serpens]|nr:hypothetical protein F5B17DRAFT_421905 [Nemania serpens]
MKQEMDTKRSNYQPVRVTDDHEDLSPTSQIPKPFACSWETSGPISCTSTKDQTLLSRIEPYLRLIDTALVLFITGVLAMLLVLPPGDGRKALETRV